MAPLRNWKCLCAGVVALGGSVLAQEPTRPAVRLLPAQPMTPVEGLIARGAAFDPLAKPDSRLNDAPRFKSLFDTSKDREPEKPSDPGPLKKLGKWMDDKATAVKKKLDAPPAEQPPPRVGQTEKGPLQKLFEDKSAAKPEPKKVNAATPAYRWYGYGTVVPGLNQYAPTGDYPMGSAQWYAQSGATPGAFPVPTMNPMRPAPGPDAPMYQSTVQPQPQPQPAVVQPAAQPPRVIQTPIQPPQQPAYATPPEPRVVPVPVRRTIAETPPVQVPGLVPQVAPPMPSTFSPTTAPTVPGVPATANLPKMTVVPKPEPAWKPVSATEPAKPEPAWKPVDSEPLIVPVIRGAAPTLDESPLAKTIQAACKGIATNVVIRETGPRQLAVSFSAPSNALAETAAKAVANLVELKDVNIDFKASVASNQSR